MHDSLYGRRMLRTLDVLGKGARSCQGSEISSAVVRKQRIRVLDHQSRPHRLYESPWRRTLGSMRIPRETARCFSRETNEVICALHASDTENESDREDALTGVSR